ncbi:Tat (twin-arginine translocation) pathway signal sequence [Nonomuraea maritima]|uniref:Tat (Twin-arginine translocation) pathway signal sequence n=1 Tax=Nonomuraea maritima TaxID=683260 RepID=A0A1G9BBB5_9ACTN|nr:twin-arginine translocation signal domain-containing protein [Nonomuraea maritima]SDK36862.1 Tat (twin-arginine translocation) pathway signal sequence [Nonomuraea maritima]
MNRISRRDVLKATAAMTAVGAGRLMLGPQPAAAATRYAGDAVTPRPVSMAMHIHASWSEGAGSMQGHLEQATKAGIDVMWWTEHDFRMAEHGYPGLIHMNGPSEQVNGVEWKWAEQRQGTLASSEVLWDKAMASPGDETTPGSVRLSATSAGRDEAAVRISGTGANTVHQRSLYDQTIELDVFPAEVSPHAYLAVVISTSWRPATAGRPAGQYKLTYIVDGTQGKARKASGLEGVVHLPARQGRWNTLRFSPEEDLKRFWPDLESRDAAMLSLTLGAVSTKERRAEGWFDLLRISRPTRSADDVLQVQADLMAGYAHRFPAVRQYQGLEVSLFKPTHFNWFGPRITMPEFAKPQPVANPDPKAALSAVEMIHSTGGLVSYNHPFGTSHPAELSPAEQDALRASVAKTVLADRAMGCDILEVGYPSRGGVDLDRHAQVWDVCSRNAIFLTGTGVSDDHSGQNWLGQDSNFVTWAHAPSRELPDLLAALASGRVFFGDPARFSGVVDLQVDGSAPMGSVTTSTAATRNVRAILTGLPADGVVRVVQGTVDLAGPDKPEPGTTFTEMPASQWAPGYVDLPIDTWSPRFVRIEVRDRTGQVLALSNPVWLLRDTPAEGIPAPRRAH